MALLDVPVRLNLDGLLANLRREGTPDRVYFMELFLDAEVQDALCARYGIGPQVDPDAPLTYYQRLVNLYQFLGYESVYFHTRGVNFPHGSTAAPDTERDQSRGQRNWVDEHQGTITSWQDFETYDWPDVRSIDLRHFEWAEKNLPDQMCVQVHTHGIFENVSWLLSLEKMAYLLYDDPALVDALFERVGSIQVSVAKVLSQFRCVRTVIGGDDMGHKTGCMIDPKVLMAKCLPWHKRLCGVYRERGIINILHCCGNTRDLMPALIDDVGYDGFHSFEDTIELVTDAKREYGDRAALIGGIDVDFLCRADESAIRRRVRETLAVCQPGGGYCLGTGNSVANYIPVDHYLIMLDEGRRWTG